MRFCVFTALKSIEVIHQTTQSNPVAFQNEIMGFRGTCSVSDIITDMKFVQRDFGGGKVHAGFKDMYRAVDLDVGTPVVVAGHSMGASLAALHAFSLEASGIKLSAVYLFAMPKFCNKSFQEEYNSLLGQKTFNIRNKNDVVTRIPPFKSYHHVGRTWDCTFDVDSILENHSLDQYKKELHRRYETFSH